MIGNLKEGERIPSARDLAVESEVNPNTVIRAYSFLQEHGIITNKRGLGYFVEKKSRQTALCLKKNQFLKEELPVFMKTLNLLQLTLDEIKELPSIPGVNDDKGVSSEKNQ